MPFVHAIYTSASLKVPPFKSLTSSMATVIGESLLLSYDSFFFNVIDLLLPDTINLHIAMLINV